MKPVHRATKEDRTEPVKTVDTKRKGTGTHRGQLESQSEPGIKVTGLFSECREEPSPRCLCLF